MKTSTTHRPTILCLINSAAYSRSYFEQLAPLVREQGYEVVFALDSHLTDVLYANDLPLVDAWYFTDFVRSNLERLEEIFSARSSSWTSLFSDFDRYLTMEIAPPLRKDGPLQYRHIPSLLELFFEKLFDALSPCAVLYEPVSNSFALAAHRSAKQAKIPFCSLSPSRIPGRVELSLTGALEDDEVIGNLYRSGGIRDESRIIAAQYLNLIDSQIPDYMKTNGLEQVDLIGKYISSGKIAHFLKGLRYRRRHAQDCSLAYQHGDPVALSKAFVIRALKRRLRLSRVSKYYHTDIKRENFLLYPLHFHPEASTSIWAADYVEELSVIKAVAFRLPTGFTLYVKEHPSAVALQPLSFYRQLGDLPNVRLLAPQLPTKELVRRSLGVVTLTSTVGFEAAVLNKPVIVMGNVFYSYFPNVRRALDYSSLSACLDWALGYSPLPAEELIEATASYVEFSTPGSFDFRASLGNRAALKGVADLIVNRLRANTQRAD